jgi:DNA-binding response OmpR family regulator
MYKQIRILMLEDEVADAQLISRELRAGGLSFSLVRVQTRQYFQYELQNHTPDLILSDHGLPSFDGISALALAQERCPDVPFIFVSAKHGEEAAVEALQKGATDYILKDRLSRLVPAVRCALRQTEDTQKRNKEYLRQLAELCPDALSATLPVK